MFEKLLADRLLVRLDPVRKQIGSILVPDIARANPVRTGVILEAGPGRYVRFYDRERQKYREVLRPLDAHVGERVAFLIGSVDTKTGQAVTHYLQEDERVIREDDVLFEIPAGVNVEVSL